MHDLTMPGSAISINNIGSRQVGVAPLVINQIMSRLATSVPGIRLGHVVTAVKHWPGCVEVTCALPAQQCEDLCELEVPRHVTLRARRAIITLPLGVLKVSQLPP
jgi:hypothetical protein